MVLERERDIIKLFLTETLGTFCKNHLSYSSQITIDGLVGVTIDQSNVILVTIKESIEPSGKACGNFDDGEYLPSEKSSPLCRFPGSNTTDGDQRKAGEKQCSKFAAPYQSKEVMPVKLEASGPFGEEVSAEDKVSTGQSDFGLDLTLHARNHVTVIELDDSKESVPECGALIDPCVLGREAEGGAPYGSGDVYPLRCPVDKSGPRLSMDGKQVSRHLILPFFMTHHRTNFKKRKIQLLSNEPSDRGPVTAGTEGELSALGGGRTEEVKVKTECSSPSLNLKPTSGDGNHMESSTQDPMEVVGCSTSPIGKSNLVGSQAASVTNRWLGSSQLPWADFQNMLIKSWRRNHHEEMLLKPLAHALIESWTNLSDTATHKRIGECVQAILLYEGRYVPVRDIQRLRLSSMTSQEIRSTMEFLNSTREGKVGCYREIRGGIGVFYKCPPHLVDLEFLESFGLSLTIYETRYASRMVSNATNRHSAVYWYRIETCSPYLTSTEVL